MRDDLHARIQKSLVVAGVIGMVVSHDEVLDRLIGDTLDQRHQSVIVRLAGKFPVHHDQSLAGHADRGIAAGAGDHVQPGLDLLDGLRLWSAASSSGWSGRLLSLRKHGGSQNGDGNRYRRCAAFVP